MQIYAEQQQYIASKSAHWKIDGSSLSFYEISFFDFPDSQIGLKLPFCFLININFADPSFYDKLKAPKTQNKAEHEALILFCIFSNQLD